MNSPLRTLACALGLATLSSVTTTYAADAPAAGPAADGAVAQACRDDVKSLCPDMQPGGGRIAACLKKQRAKISAGCKEALKEAQAGRKAAQ